jgi:hypothetical protein
MKLWMVRQYEVRTKRQETGISAQGIFGPVRNPLGRKPSSKIPAAESLVQNSLELKLRFKNPFGRKCGSKISWAESPVRKSLRTNSLVRKVLARKKSEIEFLIIFYLGESIPIRLFLGGYDLTPTMKDVQRKFSVRYFLNLVLVDEEERRYFKQQVSLEVFFY